MEVEESPYANIQTEELARAKAMSDDALRGILRDEFGLDRRYLQYAERHSLVFETGIRSAWKKMGKQYNGRSTYATLPDGTWIYPDGETELWANFALLHLGYSIDAVLALDDVYEEWCRVTGNPVSEEHKAWKEKQRLKQEKQDAKNNIVRFKLKQWGK